MWEVDAERGKGSEGNKRTGDQICPQQTICGRFSGKKDSQRKSAFVEVPADNTRMNGGRFLQRNYQNCRVAAEL